MTKQCPICGKKYLMVGKTVKLRGKYNPTIKKKKYPNLQWVFVPNDVENKKFRAFAGQRIRVCAKCLKTLSKI